MMRRPSKDFHGPESSQNSNMENLMVETGILAKDFTQMANQSNFFSLYAAKKVVKKRTGKGSFRYQHRYQGPSRSKTLLLRSIISLYTPRRRAVLPLSGSH